MAGDFGFGIFAALMIVLAVFVVRFSIRLNRERSSGSGSSSSSGSGGSGGQK